MLSFFKRFRSVPVLLSGFLRVCICVVLGVITGNIPAANGALEEVVSKTNELLVITVNGRSQQAVFEDNASARAFRELLRKNGSLTVSMRDYGDMEKVGDLGTSLVRSDKPIRAVPGDVVLYLGTSITVYYDTNSWNFTRMAHIKGATSASMRSFLGEGEVEITFSLSND